MRPMNVMMLENVDHWTISFVLLDVLMVILEPQWLWVSLELIDRGIAGLSRLPPSFLQRSYQMLFHDGPPAGVVRDGCDNSPQNN